MLSRIREVVQEGFVVASESSSTQGYMEMRRGGMKGIMA
jgi:hypothetical protein